MDTKWLQLSDASAQPMNEKKGLFLLCVLVEIITPTMAMHDRLVDIRLDHRVPQKPIHGMRMIRCPNLGISLASFILHGWAYKCQESRRFFFPAKKMELYTILH